MKNNTTLMAMFGDDAKSSDTVYQLIRCNFRHGFRQKEHIEKPGKIDCGRTKITLSF